MKQLLDRPVGQLIGMLGAGWWLFTAVRVTFFGYSLHWSLIAVACLCTTAFMWDEAKR